jgi:hypothetical protein
MSRAVFVRSLARGALANGAALGVVMLAVSACSAGSMGGGETVGPSGTAASGGPDLATQEACRQRVNEMYEIRDRADIYTAAPPVNTPYSANSYVGVPSRGLSNQFAYERSEAECEQNAISGAAPVAGPPIPPPPVPPGAKGR